MIPLLFCGMFGASEAPTTRPACEYRVEKRELKLSGEQEPLQYLLLKPATALQSSAGPLLIYLYGAGGSINGYNLRREEYAGLRRLLCERGYTILVPELGPSHWMNQRARRMLDAIVDHVLAERSVDSRRVHVMGTSMGGGSALAYAIHRPRLVRSVCSVLGMTDFRRWYAETKGYGGPLEKAFGGSPETMPDAYREVSALDHLESFADTPVFLIYGEKDTLVKPDHGRRLAAALVETGASATYREAKGIGHADTAVVGFERELADFFDRAGRRASSPGRMPSTQPVQP